MGGLIELFLLLYAVGIVGHLCYFWIFEMSKRSYHLMNDGSRRVHAFWWHIGSVIWLPLLLFYATMVAYVSIRR